MIPSGTGRARANWYPGSTPGIWGGDGGSGSNRREVVQTRCNLSKSHVMLRASPDACGPEIIHFKDIERNKEKIWSQVTLLYSSRFLGNGDATITRGLYVRKSVFRMRQYNCTFS